MKKLKVKWREHVVNYYSTEVDAISKIGARRLILENIADIRTNVSEEDHSEV